VRYSRRLNSDYTSPVQRKVQVSRLDAPMQQLQTEDGTAMSEVNPWLWQFGRGRPRLAGLTVEQTTVSLRVTIVRQANASEARKKRGAEIRRSRKADQA
jgi:hypothetical protein